MLLSIIYHLCSLGLCYISGINAACRLPLGMDGQHDARRLFPIHAKEIFQYLYHKIHWRIVVVQYHHLVQGWWRKLGPGFLNGYIALMITLGIGILAIQY